MGLRFRKLWPSCPGPRKILSFAGVPVSVLPLPGSSIEGGNGVGGGLSSTAYVRAEAVHHLWGDVFPWPPQCSSGYDPKRMKSQR